MAEADVEPTRQTSPSRVIRLPDRRRGAKRNVDPGPDRRSRRFKAPILFTIAEDLTQMEVLVDVDEADVGKVREGQSGTFTVEALPRPKTFNARISQLRYGAETVRAWSPTRRCCRPTIPTLLLRPGMTATAEIVVQAGFQCADPFPMPRFATLRRSSRLQIGMSLLQAPPGPPALPGGKPER